MAPLVLILLSFSASPADFDGSYILPDHHAAIRYSDGPRNDRVSRLERQLRDGKVKLEFDAERGYLPALLRALQIPVSSQVLVFSKTSFQASRISPRNPRALYFTDDLYVGWVPGGDVIEIAATDPTQGVIFYTLDQERSARPRIDRRDDCLQCHASGGTIGVPGLVVRSVFVERSGMPLFQAGGYVTDHRSPLAQRWGGWYVTGNHGSQRHMGNAQVPDRDHPQLIDREAGANLDGLDGRLDTGKYLAPSSDIVALMVLEHQTRMTNILTRAGWETRIALADQRAMNAAFGEPPDAIGENTLRRIGNAAESVVKSLLFLDEARLEDAVSGLSGFAETFGSRGPLYRLDLTTRMFRIPCSYLIDSAQYEALPAVLKDRTYRLLLDVLTGRDQSPIYARLTADDRRSVMAILKRSKPEFAALAAARE